MRKASQTPAQPADVTPGKTESGLEALYSSPEFLIRRAHQIASAAFAEACADLEITPSQYATLFALRQYAPIGQNALGRLVALDRSTTSMVVKSLKDRGLVVAAADPTDLRKTSLDLSAHGRLQLAKAEQRSRRAGRALLAAFEPGQARAFIDMLKALTARAEEERAPSR